MNSLQPILALALINTLYGLGYPLVKIVVTTMSPRDWILIRIFACALILLAICFRDFFSKSVTVKQLFWLAVSGVLGMVANQIFFAEGLYRTTPAHSAIINATVPIQTVLFARIFLNEKLGAPKIFGVLLGFLGVVILLRVEDGFWSNPFLKGDGLTLINAASYSLFLIFSPKAMKGLSPTVALLWMTLLGMPFALAYTGVHMPAVAWGALNMRVWGALAYLVLIQTVFTYSLNLWALQRTTASHASLYVYLQPVVAAVASFYLLGDQPGFRFYASGALIFLGILMASAKK